MKTAQAQIKKRSFGSVAAVITLLIFIGLLGLAALHRQDIDDWWRLRHYTAPVTVVQLATQDTMTPYARKVLYVNAPQLQTKTAFKNCNLGAEQAAVLGCYHSNQAGIFVLSVTDPRLNGIEQVTAAHEMLHAAYDRLSSQQRQSVDSLLEDYYAYGLHDQTILDQMANYKKTEPHDVVNEMHSVFGTEVTNLPPALEQYYKQYFVDRAKVAGFYNNYQAEFTTRQTTIKADDAQLATLNTTIKTDDTQLTTLKSQIDSQESSLKSQASQLQTAQAQLNEYRQAGNASAYNAGISSYNSQADAYNAQAATLKGLIDQYNQSVDVRNALAVQYQQLLATRNSVALEAQQLTSEITSQASPLSQ
jgi:hypothetical protein